ncbi:vicilin-like seed storage protein At2g28490 [Phalaenopsis equestris]|uniref:vicilin-like seed storage protein At2g28490 n=1 Tax=Phalaenopsis equestris TaxID=78828 RepID=UPI0009E4FDBA|nr:vicilin-like seed storage protein At2g28490 [Phalaenopsis equestris]
MKMERWEKVSGRRLAIICFYLLVSTATSSDGREWDIAGEGGGAGGHERAAPFLLKETRVVSKSEGGEIRVFKSPSWNGRPPRILVSFVTMEANTLLIPHYMDADLILFLLKGEAKAGWIHEDDLVERQLKPGDVLHVPAGSAFYFVNTRKDQKLQFIGALESLESDLIGGSAFFIDGGKFPTSVFAGFDISTLTSAFNATPEEVGVLKSASFAGSIIFNTDNEANHLHEVISDMKSEMKRLKQSRPLKQNSGKKTVSWTTILGSIFFGETAKEKNKAKRRASDPVEAPDAYNVYDREPDFKNDYGWSVEINGDDYLPLKQSDISITLLSLSTGSMMAPHMNSRATEYGVVIAGAGTVEVVYPNGTQAMKAEVREGDVFWVPTFYPFCQVASRENPMEILGFTTSWRRSRPQFLVGKSSILRKMIGSELAAGFGITEEELRKLVTKQNESMILPSLKEAGGRG